MKKFKDAIKNAYSLDLRSLAALRVGVAFYLLADLVSRSRDLIAHYTDAGILPRSVLVANQWNISLHVINGTWQVETGLFAIAGIFALSLLIGYRTKLSTVVSWILLVSLQNRNPLILHGSDTLLRMVLFWGMFLPWEKKWSVDSALERTGPTKGGKIFSVATFAYTAQIAMIYIFTAYFKSGPTWHNGTALYYSLHAEEYTSSIGLFLLGFPSLLSILSYVAYWIEYLSPCGLLFPLFSRQLRNAALTGLFALHAGILFAMSIPMFASISLISFIALLPGGFWDYLNRKLNPRSSLTIYYDSECGFCYNSVRILKTFLFLSNSAIASAQNNAAIAEEMVKNNSWVVVDSEGRRHIKFDGFLAVLSASPLRFLVPLLRIAFVANIGDRIYEWVALHRKTVCPVNAEPSKQSRYSSLKPITLNLIALVFLVYVTAWNLWTIPSRPYTTMPEGIQWIAQSLRLDQIWNMFSDPPRTTGWYAIPGTLANQATVDIFSDTSTISFKKPESISGSYINYRWLKYLTNLPRADFAAYRSYYAKYLCKKWNWSHTGETQLKNFEIIYVQQSTLPDNHHTLPQKISLGRYNCS